MGAEAGAGGLGIGWQGGSSRSMYVHMRLNMHACAHAYARARMHACRYDPLALVASVPQLASKYFEFEEVRVGNTTHRVAGVSKEQCGVKAGSGLPEMLLAAFLEGIQPPASTELQRLRAELLEERATSARLQQEVDGLRALK